MSQEPGVAHELDWEGDLKSPERSAGRDADGLESESDPDGPTLFGVTDGKAVGLGRWTIELAVARWLRAPQRGTVDSIAEVLL